MHPLIGLQPHELHHQLHLYVRPDYRLAYTPEERKALRAANPDDYDDAVSCEIVEHGEPIGDPGNVLMTLVYGSGYGINKLLCHGAVLARGVFRQTPIDDFKNDFLKAFRPQAYAHAERAEQAEADRAMSHTALRGLRSGVITIQREKKRLR